MIKSVVDLPFNQHVGIQVSDKENGILELPAGSHYLNHLGTVHASAQLALAEASSGEFLLRRLCGYENIIPVVRRVEAKFKKPAKGQITSTVVEKLHALDNAIEDLQNKGRCLVEVEVDIHDEAGNHALHSRFEWFISMVNVNSKA